MREMVSCDGGLSGRFSKTGHLVSKNCWKFSFETRVIQFTLMPLVRVSRQLAHGPISHA